MRSGPTRAHGGALTETVTNSPGRGAARAGGTRARRPAREQSGTRARRRGGEASPARPPRTAAARIRGGSAAAAAAPGEAGPCPDGQRSPFKSVGGPVRGNDCGLHGLCLCRPRTRPPALESAPAWPPNQSPLGRLLNRGFGRALALASRSIPRRPGARRPAGPCQCPAARGTAGGGAGRCAEPRPAGAGGPDAPQAASLTRRAARRSTAPSRASLRETMRERERKRESESEREGG